MKLNKGFTLIELLVVISIIGVLAGLGASGIPAFQRYAKKTQTSTVMASVAMALDNYKTDMGVYPQTDDPVEISNALTGISGANNQRDNRYYGNPDWRGPYFTIDQKSFVHRDNSQAIADAWGNPLNFSILAPTRNPYKFDMWSSGPDGKNDQGLKDDVRQ